MCYAAATQLKKAKSLLHFPSYLAPLMLNVKTLQVLKKPYLRDATAKLILPIALLVQGIDGLRVALQHLSTPARLSGRPLFL